MRVPSARFRFLHDHRGAGLELRDRRRLTCRDLRLRVGRDLHDVALRVGDVDVLSVDELDRAEGRRRSGGSARAGDCRRRPSATEQRGDVRGDARRQRARRRRLGLRTLDQHAAEERTARDDEREQGPRDRCDRSSASELADQGRIGFDVGDRDEIVVELGRMDGGGWGLVSSWLLPCHSDRVTRSGVRRWGEGSRRGWPGRSRRRGR